MPRQQQQQQRPPAARQPPQPPQPSERRQPLQQQQQQWEAAPVASPVADVDGLWACQVCTYEHTGPESKFLSCAMCGTPKV